MITARNILKHEIIGLRIEATKMKDTGFGVMGIVTDETKNMICINDGKRDRMIPKEISKFKIYLDDGNSILVEGKKLVGRSENRLKTKMRSW